MHYMVKVDDVIKIIERYKKYLSFNTYKEFLQELQPNRYETRYCGKLNVNIKFQEQKEIKEDLNIEVFYTEQAMKDRIELISSIDSEIELCNRINLCEKDQKEKLELIELSLIKMAEQHDFNTYFREDIVVLKRKLLKFKPNLTIRIEMGMDDAKDIIHNYIELLELYKDYILIKRTNDTAEKVYAILEHIKGNDKYIVQKSIQEIDTECEYTNIEQIIKTDIYAKSNVIDKVDMLNLLGYLFNECRYYFINENQEIVNESFYIGRRKYLDDLRKKTVNTLCHDVLLMQAYIHIYEMINKPELLNVKNIYQYTSKYDCKDTYINDESLKKLKQRITVKKYVSLKYFEFLNELIKQSLIIGKCSTAEKMVYTETIKQYSYFKKSIKLIDGIDEYDEAYIHFLSSNVVELNLLDWEELYKQDLSVKLNRKRKNYLEYMKCYLTDLGEADKCRDNFIENIYDNINILIKSVQKIESNLFDGLYPSVALIEKELEQLEFKRIDLFERNQFVDIDFTGKEFEYDRLIIEAFNIDISKFDEKRREIELEVLYKALEHKIYKKTFVETASETKTEGEYNGYSNFLNLLNEEIDKQLKVKRMKK